MNWLKEHISVPKTWQVNFLWGLALVGVLIVYIAALNRQANLPLNALDIHFINDNGSRKLISSKEIKNRIKNQLNEKLTEVSIKELDLISLEYMIEKDSRIEQVEMYVGADNVLNANVYLRQPIVRIMSQNGEDYYIDNYGNKIETVHLKAARVTVATGYIQAYDHHWQQKPKHRLNDVYQLVSALEDDKVLDAIVEQIDIDKDGNTIIIPKLGPEKLFMGNIQEDLDAKLLNIKTLYKKVLKNKQYASRKVINMDIANQIRPTNK